MERAQHWCLAKMFDFLIASQRSNFSIEKLNCKRTFFSPCLCIQYHQRHDLWQRSKTDCSVRSIYCIIIIIIIITKTPTCYAMWSTWFKNSVHGEPLHLKLKFERNGQRKSKSEKTTNISIVVKSRTRMHDSRSNQHCFFPLGLFFPSNVL